MPPKKVETPTVVELPDQPPTFESDQFMDDLLQRAKARNVEALEAGVAAALNTEDFRTNLRKGILVDFAVEAILFASQQNFAARKTAAFLRWMNEMRVSIETTGSVEGAKTIFKNHLVSHAERSNRDAGTDAAAALPSLTDDSAAEKALAATASSAAQPAAASSAKPPPSKKDAGKKPSGPKSGGADEAAAKPPVDTNVFLSVADMGQVAEFIVTGLLQHWQLYHFAATAPEPEAESTTFTLTVQTAIRPPPLARALTQEQHDQQCEDERARAEAELVRLRDEERAAMEEQRRRAEAAEAERRRAEEEEAASRLYFAKVGTEKAVERVQAEVEAAQRDRQQQLLERILALEKLVAASPA